MSTDPDDADATIERILDEPPPCTRQRERSEFDRLSAGRRNLILHGAGLLGRKVLAGLRSVGVEPVAFSDSACASWGSVRDGIPVLSPADAAAKWASSAAFVICTFSPGTGRTHELVASELSEQGAEMCVSFVPLFWKYAEIFLPHMRLDLPSKVVTAARDVRRAYDLLSDDRSRHEFARQLRWLTAPTFGALSVESPESEFYFPADIVRLGREEVFVDCGAFDGDSILLFLAASGSRFAAIHAFEPDPLSFSRLTDAVAALDSKVRERIVLHACATGSEPGTVMIEATGTLTSSIVNSGQTAAEVPVVRLDDALPQGATYIKMDVEGYEPYVLAGARRIIAECAPMIAASAYHVQSHLWELILQIDGYRRGYGYHMRRYGDQFGDVVCYAAP